MPVCVRVCVRVRVHVTVYGCASVSVVVSVSVSLSVSVYVFVCVYEGELERGAGGSKGESRNGREGGAMRSQRPASQARLEAKARKGDTPSLYFCFCPLTRK